MEKRHSRVRALAGLLVLLVGAGLTACTLFKKPAQLYRLFLNRDVPAEAQHFEGKGNDNPFFDFMSWGYFTYELEPAAWKKLLHHKQFAQESEWNREFAPLPPPALDAWHLDYYSKLVRHPITLSQQHTVACSATFFPYIHTLVYDSTAHRVQHFVAAMRD